MEQMVVFREGLKIQTREAATLRLIFISLQRISAQSIDGRDTFPKDLNSALMIFGWWMLKEQIIVWFVFLSLFLTAWAQTSGAGSHPSPENEPHSADIFNSNI